MEAKAADRAPHLKKRHMPGADDATLLARNMDYKYSPIEAVRGTNEEALKATPREYVKDSLEKHVPLQGTAIIPPGMAGLDGRTMEYEEGADLMREPDAPGGPYRRWEHVVCCLSLPVAQHPLTSIQKYLPDDYKGKGEPSFSIEKALKNHDRNAHRRVLSDGNSAYEMQSRNPESSRQRSASGSYADAKIEGKATTSARQEEAESSVKRSNTTGRRVGEGLKKRFGSLRRSKNKTVDS
jgi:hypothetical protein